jgi:2,3-dihydroxy-p-cumate/2,3-dihydroxybenzoate 3,4-dioxygenase
VENEMIEHLVAFRFRDDSDAAARAELLDALRQLPQHFPAMIDFRLGNNVSNRDDRFSHAFTVRFASVELLDAYLTSARHEAFVVDMFRPIVAERAIVSFEY